MKSIKINKLNYTYPKTNFNISVDDFVINSNQLTIILGDNGCGKTTFLKVLLKIINCNNYDVFIDDQSINDYSLGQIGKNIGYLFQEPNRQLFTSNVWDEMTFIAYMLNVDVKVASDKAISLLKKFNLFKNIKQSIYTLSRGEKQRLAICTILMNDIEFLVLDEPTTGLDNKNCDILFETIDLLIKDNIGVLIITHDEKILNRYTQARIITMSNGKIIGDSNG